MHVLVTGGGGYIGSTLVPHLLGRGHHVSALDRFFFGEQTLSGAQALYGDRLHLVRADVRTAGEEVFEGVDALVDLAGISNDPACELDPQLTLETNLEGARRMHAAAARAGVGRIVFASSCSVYGHGASEALTESSELNPVSLYARCKVEGERSLFAVAASAPVTATALRFATVFGLSGRTRFDVAVNVMTKNAYLYRKITVDGGGKQWRPFVHVRDVAETIATVLEQPCERVAGQVYNVGSDANNLRIINLAYRIRDHVPGCEVVMAASDPDLRDYNVSFEHLREHLGFVPRWSIDDGIEEVLAGLREGRVDPEDRRGYTLKHYSFLCDVERAWRELSLAGRLLT